MITEGAVGKKKKILWSILTILESSVDPVRSSRVTNMIGKASLDGVFKCQPNPYQRTN